MESVVFSPSEFVGVLNQTLDFAYPIVVIEGELANVRVSRNRWVYFDIKDETASVKCFGTVYMLPGPIEEGMVVRITASPRLHPLYNFSLNFQSIMPVGEGSLKRAADLLAEKLNKEGLFDPERKRPIPFAPTTIGLITSKESAAYHDFMKILNERWAGVKVIHHDVQVQGEQAVIDIAQAITTMNLLSEPEVLVITRGGGSADDLAAFSTEPVVRAIAGSRIPTLVAIGHEVDLSLAELAADMRASTPSNAAQLLTPDKQQILQTINEQKRTFKELLTGQLQATEANLKQDKQSIKHLLEQAYYIAEQTLGRQSDLLEALNPEAALRRGYAVIQAEKGIITSVKQLKKDQAINIKMHDGRASATVNEVQ
jgi:exodeoxyribonuclease VII large subunit